jgi:hypothetical protein
MSLPNKPPPSGPVHTYNAIEGTFDTPWNAVLYPPLMPLQSIHELSVHKASSSMTLPTPLPLLIAGSMLASSLLPTPSISLTFTRCPNIVSDKLVLMKMPRDECCRGLPGDALCVPCNAGPLSLSATSKRMVYQLGPDTMTVLLLPREECCRGLPGDAQCVPCNAGPLSLSAYPQSYTSQTADIDLPQANYLQSHLTATDSPMSLPSKPPLPGSIHPNNAIEGTLDTPCWNTVLNPPLMPLQSIHNQPIHKALSSMTLSTPLPLPTADTMLSPSLLPTPLISPTLIRCPNRVSDNLEELASRGVLFGSPRGCSMYLLQCRSTVSLGIS